MRLLLSRGIRYTYVVRRGNVLLFCCFLPESRRVSNEEALAGQERREEQEEN